MTALSDLIARLEAAKEESRELDAWIFCLVEHPDKKPEHNLFYKNREEWGVFISNAPSPGMTFHDAPHYTTSLDVALTLVPDSWRGITIETTQAGFWLASLSPVFQTQPVNYPCYGSIAYTAPLAVVAAILKARKETP